MITLSFLDGNSNLSIQECSTIDEAMEYDYKILVSLGNDCDYYYKGYKLDLDTINCTQKQIKRDIEKQIGIIDKIKENEPTSIVNYILNMQKDISLIKDRISNIEYEMKKNK